MAKKKPNLQEQQIPTEASNGVPSNVPDEIILPSEESITLEIDELPGKIVGLSDASVLWRSPSDVIELSHFTGKVTYTITKDTTERDLTAIYYGIKTGRLRIVESDMDISPAVSINVDPTLLARVNIFLDEKNLSKFSKNVKDTASSLFINMCFQIESTDRKRKDYMEILSERMKEI